GVPGTLTSVDAAPPPFAGSHQLQTTATPKDGANYHGCGVVDIYTPLQTDGVTPLFRDVWIYMIGPASNGPTPLTVSASVSSNDFTLTWPAMPGEIFNVQTSTNLTDWTDAATDLFAASFSIQHVVTNALS